MFRGPSDPPEPLRPLAGSEHIARMHTDWARLHASPSAPATLGTRIRRRARSAAFRFAGGTDRELLADLIPRSMQSLPAAMNCPAGWKDSRLLPTTWRGSSGKK